MKKVKERKLNNNGFSLVELIIVIAIMAVLVGVLSPQFIKYVEQSRRATDIQNAQSIQTAILADIADGKIDADASLKKIEDGTITAIAEAPKIKGTLLNNGGNFYATYDVDAGTCHVYPTNDGSKYDLTTTDGAAAYKSGKATTEESSSSSEATS